MDGFLNVLKPPGLTSFQVVRRVRRLTGEHRVGHGGTLDPAAEGVLPVALGQATRTLEFLLHHGKVYRAEAMLGVATDTYDAQGRVTGGQPSTASRQEIEASLACFRGEVWQRPPAYSAIKMGGQPLYRRARRGEVVSPPERKVHIYRLEVSQWHLPQLTLEIECGAGTYIRSLVHDLGAALGCGAHLRRLHRLRSGPFGIEEAVPLATLEQEFPENGWRWLYPVDVVLLGWPAVILGEKTERHISHGGQVTLASAPQAPTCRAYTRDGRFLAVLRRRDSQWHPYKVFALSPEGPT